MTRITLASFLALSLAALVPACNAATLQRIDPGPSANPKVCPMQCPRGCCTLGDADTDGMQCLATNAASPDVCQWAGVVGPEMGAKKPALVPTTAPSPVVPPKSVTSVRTDGKG